MKTHFLSICFLLLSFFCAAQIQQAPNILIIMTDQQFADAMSCAMGDEYIHTPNMDKLAASGVRFTRAYSPNPLCTPMRTSMMTGMFPHQTRVQTNNDKKNFRPEDHIYMGRVFRDAGFETGYFGKWHVALDEDEKDLHGFFTFGEDNPRLDAGPVGDFIKEKRNKPFFAFASFLSPHEVCQWARKEELPGEPLADMPELEALPPLKDNFGVPQNETDIEAYMRRSYQSNRRFTVGDYTYADWRRLRWGYYRLIERADIFVGEVLESLEASGKKENTIVVFLSDHGDCAGSHHWNQKTVFYDESTRVPYIVSMEGKTTGSTSDILVNVGIDLIPTLCELTGVEVPNDLPGKSMAGMILGSRDRVDRDYLVIQNHMVQGDPVDDISLMPHGRMVRSEHFKYCLYSEGNKKESLVDMRFDPLEMINQAENPIYRDVLEQHRTYLQEHADKQKDEVAQNMLDML